MDKTELPDIKGATKLSPLDMNKIEILKDHTVITFDRSDAQSDDGK